MAKTRLKSSEVDVKDTFRNPATARLSAESFARCQRGALGPDWRVQTAGKLVPRRRRVEVPQYEPILLELADYFGWKQRLSNGDVPPRNRFSLFSEAEQLNADAFVTKRLKLMVLAEMTHEEMRLRTDTDLQVVRIWEQMFFDVRGQRVAASWLEIMVIDKEVRDGEVELAQRMKLAIAVGPVGVRLMLDSEESPPLDEADRLMRSRLRINLKLHQLADTRTSSENMTKHIALHARLIFEENRLKLAYKKLESRCAESIRRHELAMERLRHAERRALEKTTRIQALKEARNAQRTKTKPPISALTRRRAAASRSSTVSSQEAENSRAKGSALPKNASADIRRGRRSSAKGRTGRTRSRPQKTTINPARTAA